LLWHLDGSPPAAPAYLWSPGRKSLAFVFAPDDRSLVSLAEGAAPDLWDLRPAAVGEVGLRLGSAASSVAAFRPESGQALARLGQEPTLDWAGVRVGSAGPWRIDPLLAQAKLLTDLGLDRLAQRDMELVGKRANPRDLLGLKALILGRQG